MDLTQLAAWVAGGAVATALLGVVWWALFADRSAGRRRCPRCWHDLSATEGLRCPECGCVARRESRLFATRRRWPLAGAALLLLVLGAGAVRVRATDENLWAWLPTRLLLWLLPVAATDTPPADGLQIAIGQRIVAGSLSPALLDATVDRIIEGDGHARPPSPEWEGRYEYLILSLLQRSIASEDDADPARAATQRLRALPPLLELTSAPLWPSDLPLLVELSIKEWWPPATHARIRVRDLADGRDRWIGLDGGARFAPPFPLEFAAPRPGETVRAFEVGVSVRPTLADGMTDPAATWSEERSWRTTVPIAVGPPQGQRLRPIRSAELDARIDQIFDQGLLVWRGVAPTGLRRAGLRFDPSPTRDPLFDGALIGLEVEVREGERVRRRSRIWWPAGTDSGPARWEIVEEDMDALERVGDGSAEWTVRLRGDPVIAARASVAPRTTGGRAAPPAPEQYTTYWAGDRTIPLRVQAFDAGAPRRRWFRLGPHDLPPEAMTTD